MALLLISNALAVAGGEHRPQLRAAEVQGDPSLNQLLHELAVPARADIGPDANLLDQLRVRGDTDDSSYKISGYANECWVSSCAERAAA